MLAEQVAALCAQVEGAGGDAAAGAGEPAAAASMADCAIAWSASLGMLAQSVAGLAANVGAAGTAYAATDANAMPSAGPR